MKAKEFVQEFNASQDKEAFVKNHIKLDYLPYAQKVSACYKIAETSAHKKIGDKKVYSLSSPMRYMLFAITIYEKYTDIDLGIGSARTESFDLLEKNNVLFFVQSCLGDEFKRFDTVLKMTVDDMYVNERDFASFFETKVDAVRLVLERIGEIYEQKNQSNISAESQSD